MKKFIALMLAMVMVFALCACGSNDSKDDTNNDAKDYSSMTLDELKAELKTVNEGYQPRLRTLRVLLPRCRRQRDPRRLRYRICSVHSR